MTHIKRDGKYWCGTKISVNPNVARATGTISLTMAIKKKDWLELNMIHGLKILQYNPIFIWNG